MERKVAIITGASRGIGAAIAIDLASNGYDVVINYINNKDSALKVQREIKSKYQVNSIIYQADVSNQTEVKEMVEKTLSVFGKIDLLVNNAGIAIDTLIEEKTIEDFDKTLKTNLIGAFICARECAKYMKKGNIINITSTNGIDTYYPYSIDYDASKAGLISLTKNLSVEYAPNIRVNAVAPGWVNTEMNKELDLEYMKEECSKILLNRFADANEIAYVVSFLASDKASYINGEIIRVDGGK